MKNGILVFGAILCITLQILMIYAAYRCMNADTLLEAARSGIIFIGLCIWLKLNFDTKK